MLSVNQIEFKSNKSFTYDVKYIKNLNRSNSLYLVSNNLDAYIEKSGENKYLILVSKDKNRKAFENYTEVWEDIKD